MTCHIRSLSKFRTLITNFRFLLLNLFIICNVLVTVSPFVTIFHFPVTIPIYHLTGCRKFKAYRHTSEGPELQRWRRNSTSEIPIIYMLDTCVWYFLALCYLATTSVGLGNLYIRRLTRKDSPEMIHYPNIFVAALVYFFIYPSNTKKKNRI